MPEVPSSRGQRARRALTFLTLSAGALALASCAKPPAFLPTSPGSGTGGTTGTVSFKSNPCSVATTLSLSVATAARIDCSNGGTTVSLAGNGASYLVVPELATDNATDSYVSYNVAASAHTTPPAGASLAPALRSLEGAPGATASYAGARLGAAQEAAYRAMRSRERTLFAAGDFRAVSRRVRAAMAGGARPAFTSVPATGSVRSFHVLSSFSGSGTWATVAARLEYVGTDVLLYVDTMAPVNGFTPTQLQQFGQYFDQTLYPIDTAAFGPPSDIDQNGHVIMLMSPVVNADTPISTCNTQGYVAGFFDSEDFAGPSDPNSNQGEVFYSIVPDPNGAVSCSHSVADLSYTVPATFMHELQHLIDFSTHVVMHGGQPETGWLDEGLSIEAEELGSLYYENKCPPPSCRTNPSQIFPDSAEGFAQGFLYDSYQYALLPDTASVTLHSDADNGFAWRGGDWALVHYLGDQFGHGVWRALEDGNATGAANIAAATGQPFPNTFANFGLALYTDSLTGLPRTTAPAADRFLTRNLRAMWARLFTTSGPATDIPYPMPIQVFSITNDTTSYAMDPGTTTFYRLDTPDSSATVTLQFSAPGAQPIPGALAPQLAIFRLPPGH
ncbi:MAG: hypothetical protein KGL38_01370 [Gemmatimonadota bacterium]|nr:hypothetical protein [Gemmatimonadota bacterium]MDE3172007.1 hypothetical protein [Gemmatimonadota bacterium]